MHIADPEEKSPITAGFLLGYSACREVYLWRKSTPVVSIFLYKIECSMLVIIWNLYNVKKKQSKM